jgi:carbonic anhydrase/acetyltransferase-like protein (isoleucine patch superfamily)
MISDHDGKSPQIHPTAWVAPNATVVGDVTIGHDVGVWYSAVARADTESITIGERTNLQDGCVLHADPGYPLVVGNGVSVGHGVILHGCRIGDNVMVGMGAIIMNGATIGDGSLIGAGTLIPENTTIPSGVLVLGSPGKVRRELAEAETESILVNAENYTRGRPNHPPRTRRGDDATYDTRGATASPHPGAMHP